MKALVFNMNLAQAAVLKSLGLVRPKMFFHGPLATVKLKDVPEPGLPGPDWLRIRTLACGFCGSDLNLIFLRESMTASPFASFPCVLGHELCGIVEQIGKDVSRFKQGDFVTVAPHLDCGPRDIKPKCRSCAAGRPNACENYAEGALAPGMFIGVCSQVGGGFAPFLTAHESQVFMLPKGAGPETGALVEPFCVGLSAVLDNQPQDGEKLLVIGGGVIGTMVVRAIRALGADCLITVSEPAPHAADIAAQSGANRIIADGDVLGHAPETTGAKSYKPLMGANILMGGFDRVYDTVGNAATLNAGLRVMAAGGALSVVGIGDCVKLDLTPLWLKSQTMKGVLAFGFHDWKGRSRHVFDIGLELISQGKARVDDLVTHSFVLDDYERMIEVNMNKAAHKAMKTIVSFD